MKRFMLICAALAWIAPMVMAADVLPPDEKGAKERLNTSARHGEWAEISLPDSNKKIKAWVVYPERKDKAPVVIVIQEIFGLSDWIRSVTVQLAADGFIAVAPDFLSGKGKDGGGTDSFPDRDAVTKAVRDLKDADVKAALDATREYALKLPAASGKTATIGFCWGGGESFKYATSQPDLNAAVVYYGTSPDAAALEKIKCPVLGNYGGNDNRVNATIKPAQEKMKELGKAYDPHIYDGAGHGFLRQQDGQNGANKKATDEAWPLTIKFLQENTK